MRGKYFFPLFLLLLSGCGKTDVTGGGGGDVDPQKEIDDLDIRPAGFVDEPSDGTADVPGVFDYSKLSVSGHPRLLMTTKDFVDLKSKLSGDKALEYLTMYGINREILKHCELYKDDKEKIELNLDESGKRNLAVSRLALRRLFNCAYAYRVTGKKAYLDKVISDLEQVCAMPHWHPSHFLDVAEMAFGVAVAYDWCYYSLDYSLRVKVRSKLLDYAINQADGQSFYNNKGNWNEVCNAGIIAAAIVTYEQNRAASRKAIEDAIPSNRRALEAIYKPDGNYHEGYGYWEYGTGYETAILQMLSKAFGSTADLEKTEGFLKTAEYILYMVGPSGMDFSYSDGGNGKERAMFPMWWFAVYQNNPSLLLNEIKLLNKSSYPTTTSAEARLLPLIPCYIKDFKFSEQQVKTPVKKLWVGRGTANVAIARIGWKNDEGDIWFGVKAGGCTFSHSHMDAGSFVFDALGKRWSMDYQRPNYADTEVKLKAAGGDFWNVTQKSLRWDLVKMNSCSHSTLSFLTNDGSVSKLHPTDQLCSGKAEIVQVYDTDDNKLGVKIDLSSIYADAAASVYRTVMLRDGRYLEIRDEIKAKSGMAATPEWRMLTPALDIQVSMTEIAMNQSSKTMYLRASASSGSAPVLAKWNSERPSEWTPRENWDLDLYAKVVGWDATVPAGQTITFTTIITPDK